MRHTLAPSPRGEGRGEGIQKISNLNLNFKSEIRDLKSGISNFKAGLSNLPIPNRKITSIPNFASEAR